MIRRHVLSVIAVAALWGGVGHPAAGVVMFLDLGSPSTGVLGGPIDHSNPTLDIYPTGSATLFLWAIPDADDNKVVCSLGHDVRITGSAAASVSVADYLLDNPLIASNARWHGTALLGGLNQGSKLIDDQRAVFVPEAEPFVGGVGSANYGIDPGYDPVSGAVYLARLDLTVERDALVGSSAELRLVVSSLLIAHVSTGQWCPEPLFFGYTAGGAEPASGTGSQIGATSTTVDATVSVVHAPADFDQDGDVGLTDHTTFVGCITGPGGSPSPVCEACDLQEDGDVDVDDFALFQLMFTGD